MTRYHTYLPQAPDLIRMYDEDGVTLDSIGTRYGTSRQAVHKRMDKYTRETFGVGIVEYRKLRAEGKLQPA